ncbi:MAG: PAS domain S-box protein [Spirochaetes bacterium]|nr:PAS domain S-box protein [Spirochaetota bacterium]
MARKSRFNPLRNMPGDDILLTWRKKAMTITLIVVAITSLPAYASVVVNALRGGSMGLLEWLYLAVYVASIVLAVLPRLDLRLRTWGLMALCYSNAAASFMRLGLVGSGRIWLVVMPVIATIVIGSRAGYAMGLLSLGLYGTFSLLAVRGVLGETMALRENPLTTGFWAEGGTALLVFLCTILVLVERFVSLQRKTLDDSMEANRQLADMAGKLRESEERLRTIGNNLPGGMIYQVVASPDGSRRFTYVSAGIERLHGLTPEAVTADPHLLYGQIQEEDAERLRGEEERAIRDGTIFDTEVRFRNASGSVRWMRLVSQPRRISGGAVIADGIELDINDRKAAEEELVAKNADLETANEDLQAAMEELESSNEEMQATMEELETTNQALIDSEMRFRSLSAFNEQLNSISISLAEAPRADDLYRIIAESYQRLTGAVVTAASRYDPERREFAVVSLHGEEGALDSVRRILGAPAGEIIFKVPPQFVEKMVSQMVIVGESIEQLSFGTISRDVSERLMKALGCRIIAVLSLHHGQSLVGAAMACLPGDCIPVPDDTMKTFAYMSGLAVTRKRSEDEIRRLNRELEEKVALRTRELTKAYNDLMSTNRDLEKALGELNEAQQQMIQREKLAALGQLTAGISHELNTPLGAIISSNRTMLEILQRKLPEALRVITTLDEDERGHFFALLDESAREASRLEVPAGRRLTREIAGMLSDAGVAESASVAELVIESGTQGLKDRLAGMLAAGRGIQVLASIVPLASIRRLGEIIAVASDRAASVVRAFQHYLKQDIGDDITEVRIHEEMETILTLYQNRIGQGVSIIRRYLTEAPVRGNRDALNQLWINLLNNSLHALEYRGTVDITIEEREGWVAVSIGDTGPGIPAPVRQRIFEPFFTTKPPGEGMGLGLNICRNIVERHGGRIEFDSTPGRTVFRVWLKAARE